MSYKSRRILQIFHSPEIYVSSVEKTNRPIQGGITTHNHAIEKIRQQQKQLSLFYVATTVGGPQKKSYHHEI